MNDQSGRGGRHRRQGTTTSSRRWRAARCATSTASRTKGIPYWGTGQIHMDGMKRMIEVQKMVGAITGDIDLAKIIDTSFLPDDIKTLSSRIGRADVQAAPHMSRCAASPRSSGRPAARASVHALGPGRSRAAQGRVLRRGRPVRLRQVDAARADRRACSARRAGEVAFEGKPIGGRHPRRRRRRVPGGRLLSLAHRRGQHRVRPAQREARRRPKSAGACATSST